MTYRVAVIGGIALSLALFGVACDDGGGGASCLQICQQAQAEQCTSISDCNAFCSASQSLAGKASCQSEHDAYLSCSRSSPTCEIDARCSSQEDAFGNCVVPFCIANSSDSDCQTMANL